MAWVDKVGYFTILPIIDLQSTRRWYLVMLSMARIYPFPNVICIGFEAASANHDPTFSFKPLLSSELYEGTQTHFLQPG